VAEAAREREARLFKDFFIVVTEQRDELPKTTQTEHAEPRIVC
jgi:hypothetical protein